MPDITVSAAVNGFMQAASVAAMQNALGLGINDEVGFSTVTLTNGFGTVQLTTSALSSGSVNIYAEANAFTVSCGVGAVGVNNVGGLLVNDKTVSLGGNVTFGTAFSTAANTFTTNGFTYTLPPTAATLARTDAAQTFTGTQTFLGAITMPNSLTIGVNFGDTSTRIQGSPTSDLGIIQLYAGGAEAIRLNASGALLGIGYLAFGSAINLADWRMKRTASNTATISSDGSTGAANLVINGSLRVGTTTKLGAYTVATLPTAAAGLTAYVTDSNATLTAGIGAVVTGGGTNTVPVFCDGTNWRIG